MRQSKNLSARQCRVWQHACRAKRFFIFYFTAYPNCTRADNIYSVQSFTHAAASTKEEKRNNEIEEKVNEIVQGVEM